MSPKHSSIWFTKVLLIGSGFMVKFNPQLMKNKATKINNNTKKHLVHYVPVGWFSRSGFMVKLNPQHMKINNAMKIISNNIKIET